MKIREYHESDMDQVVSLWNDCALIVPWNDPRKDIARKMREKPNLFLVGEIDECIIATVMGGYEGHRGWINYLAVRPQFQGQGYGERMMNEIESRLLALNCPKVNLLVRNTNERVIDFYEKMGYKIKAVVCIGKRLISDESRQIFAR